MGKLFQILLDTKVQENIGCAILNHIGNDVTTEILGYYEDKDECMKIARSFSQDNNIVNSDDWANLKEENGIDGNPVGNITYVPTQEQRDRHARLSKERWSDPEYKKSTSEKISKARQIKNWGSWTGKTKTIDQKINDSWAQILKSNPNLQFQSYHDFSDQCAILYDQNKTICDISKLLKVDYGTVKLALSRRGIELQFNPSWTKIKKRYPNFPFDTYESFSDFCKNEHLNGKTSWCISREMNLSQDAIKTAIKF